MNQANLVTSLKDAVGITLCPSVSTAGTSLPPLVSVSKKINCNCSFLLIFLSCFACTGAATPAAMQASSSLFPTIATLFFFFSHFPLPPPRSPSHVSSLLLILLLFGSREVQTAMGIDWEVSPSFTPCFQCTFTRFFFLFIGVCVCVFKRNRQLTTILNLPPSIIRTLVHA